MYYILSFLIDLASRLYEVKVDVKILALKIIGKSMYLCD